MTSAVDIPEQVKVASDQARSDYLIARGMQSKLTAQEQVDIAMELRIYRDMAVALDAMVHDWIKKFEAAGVEL